MANRKYRYEDMQPVLERLLQDKESDELEFKTAAGGFPYTGNLASSGENLATSKENLASPDENLATSKENLASSKKKRFSKLEIEKLILDFCTEWRTIEDIATFLDRDKNYIRNEVLPQLADKLVKMYENVPHHPRQKYRVRFNY